MNYLQKIGYRILFFLWTSLVIFSIIFLLKQAVADSRDTSNDLNNLIYSHYEIILVIISSVAVISSVFLLHGDMRKKEKIFISLAFLSPVISYGLIITTALIGCYSSLWWC